MSEMDDKAGAPAGASEGIPAGPAAGDSGNDSGRQSTLATRNLKKRYKKRAVVQDVSLEVKSGEVVGLLGPNGAGKTTCFYMVVGLIACDGGDVFLDDRKITHLPIHRRAKLGVSYLPQEASVFR
jgi:lipopolysaccharide export system ATP-binding protein